MSHPPGPTADGDLQCPRCRKLLAGPVRFCPFCASPQSDEDTSKPRTPSQVERQTETVPQGLAQEADGGLGGQTPLNIELHSVPEPEPSRIAQRPPQLPVAKSARFWLWIGLAIIVLLLLRAIFQSPSQGPIQTVATSGQWTAVDISALPIGSDV